MTPWLAHSPKGTVPRQPYFAHLERVVELGERNARAVAHYAKGGGEAFVEAVTAGALLHDLGKLDDLNQEVLRRESRDPLPVPHEDAGVAALIQRFHEFEAAILVAGHHRGLFDAEVECAKVPELRLRNPEVSDRVDQLLDTYLARHQQATVSLPRVIAPTKPDRRGLWRRLALSCLVDADHTDTALHYAADAPQQPEAPQPNWVQRLASLDRYVASLRCDFEPGSPQFQRQELRDQVYLESRSAAIEPAIRSCEAPVGSGKTTAVMAHLLGVAEAKGLRHIIVVLPYTNIISQTVEVYRKALVLEDEDPELVVAEHHHQVEFESPGLRQYATLWRAPIIVTTAVQFFQTVSAYHPAVLRKLHELPGSAVFIDEAHAAMPAPLWPSAWNWLRELTEEWGVHLVLGSGSLPRFWESNTFQQWIAPPPQVPDLVSPSLCWALDAAEKTRVQIRSVPESLSLDQLIERVLKEPGPRLVILNTVQSAAVVAHRMRELGNDVLHLSTALAPAHRDLVVKRVKRRLRDGRGDWTLVATSCVEAGMDFSFRTGFRERAGAFNLIQISGRISRGSEYQEAVVWDFRIIEADGLRYHPDFELAGNVLGDLLKRRVFETMSATAIASLAMERELSAANENRAHEIRWLEEGMCYPQVAAKCRIITDDTRLVVVDLDLIEKLRTKQPVAPRQLQRMSVRIRAQKLEQLGLTRTLVAGRSDERECIYGWIGDYDPKFLGYMQGVVPLLQSLRDGLFIDC